jgi:hypothetical protein
MTTKACVRLALVVASSFFFACQSSPPPLVTLSSHGVAISPPTLLDGINLTFVTYVGSPLDAYVANGEPLISSSDGLSWQAFASINQPRAIVTLAYSDTNSTFVLSGGGSFYYQTSPATGWVPATVQSNAPGNDPGINKIIWAGAPLSKFIGVGGYGIFVSTDGVRWTSAAYTTAGMTDVVRVSSSLFVAVGLNDDAWTSTDGSVWVDRKGVVATSFGLFAVTSNGARVVAVGGQDIVYTDDGGTSWYQATRSSNARDLTAITWTGRMFVAVGLFGILASTDGATWQNGDAPKGKFSAVNADGPLVAAVGDAGLIAVGAK